MSEPTNATTETSGAETETTETTETPDAVVPGVDDDGGAALDRAEEAIKEAQDAQGSVAAHDDITTRDDAMAGEYSEDPGNEGGHP